MSDITIDQVFAQYLPKVTQILEQQLPRAFDNDTLKRYAGNARYAYDVETATKSILNPIWDMLDRGGKRWRPVLVLLVAETLGGQEDLVAPCAYLCEMVHNGTLAVDDIEDDSKLRRGKACMHLIFGVDVAINAGNAMYFLPTVIFKELRLKGVDPVKVCQAHELYEQELSNLHFGQGFDIWWHHGHKDPVVDEYLQMCAYKTGTLARLSAKLAALMSNATQEQIDAIGLFAEAIGVGFQIQDDLLNIAGEKFAAKIAVQGEDIHEGKRTLMVIHSFKHAAPEKAMTKLRSKKLLALCAILAAWNTPLVLPEILSTRPGKKLKASSLTTKAERS
jgi:geranylgeranyl pyrophosphate synthase